MVALSVASIVNRPLQACNPSKRIGERDRMKTTSLLFRIERSQIGFVKFIIEAYEGVAVVSTLNASEGLVRLSVAPGCRRIVEDIMADLAESVFMEQVNGPIPD